MEVKTFEVRDSMTCISALAIKAGARDEAERWLWSRAGFGESAKEQSCYVLVANIDSGTGKLTCDPWAQRSGTMREAHTYIDAHFDELENGAVVDVEYIRGDTDAPKISDRAVRL